MSRKVHKPTSIKECYELDCSDCYYWNEKTKESRYFADNFRRENCWVGNNFPPISWDDPYWDKFDCIAR